VDVAFVSPRIVVVAVRPTVKKSSAELCVDDAFIKERSEGRESVTAAFPVPEPETFI
jgi:hypothetical protein